MLSDGQRPRETPAAARDSKSAPLAKVWTQRQLRAVNSYCSNHGAKPQLSTYPTVYFTDKATGATVRMNVKEVTDIYDEDRKVAARERARARRAEHKQLKQRRTWS
jgi:hypothetical protein